MWKRWINTNTEDSIIKRVVGELTKTMDFSKTPGNTLVSKLNLKYNLKEFEWNCPGKLDYAMPKNMD